MCSRSGGCEAGERSWRSWCCKCTWSVCFRSLRLSFFGFYFRLEILNWGRGGNRKAWAWCCGCRRWWRMRYKCWRRCSQSWSIPLILNRCCLGTDTAVSGTGFEPCYLGENLCLCPTHSFWYGFQRVLEAWHAIALIAGTKAAWGAETGNTGVQQNLVLEGINSAGT